MSKKLVILGLVVSFINAILASNDVYAWENFINIVDQILTVLGV